MREGQGLRLPLKSKLLIGAAGAVAAAMSSPAFAADAAPPAANPPATPPAPATQPAQATAPAMTPIDPPKWLPYVDIGGGAGSGFAVGRATAFVPVWQDLNSLFFVRLGAGTRTHYSGNFNFGLGYRAKIDSDWLVGVFGGFDSSQADNDHTFNQFSLGAEAMSADWDVRANAYFANSSTQAVANKFELYIHDTTIGILQAQESGFSGFDGEVGYRIFNTDDTDVRIFAGGYSFHHSDPNVGPFTSGTGYKDVAGPKLRAEVNVFDIDALGQQSRLSFEGEVSHDSYRHTQEYAGATLRIALDDRSGGGAQALDDLDRRMVDPVRRQDNVLTQWQFNKPEPVVIYNSAIRSQPTNTIYYAEQRSGAGAGTYADPTTVQDAASRGPKDQFIVLTDRGGSTIDATGTAVQNGETLTGGGTFKVRGVDSGTVFTHDFAPGSGHVTLTASSGNALVLGSDTALYGFSIEGAFTDAIYGHNVHGVTISGVTIDGGGTGQNGIVFNQTNTAGTSKIDISNSSIVGVTQDGLDLSVTSSDGGTSSTLLNATNVTIDAGNDGVSLTSSSSGGSDATVYAGIHNSSIIAGNLAMNVSGSTSGGTLNQTVVVDPTVLSGDVYIYGHAITGTLTQNFTDTDGSIYGGFSVYGVADGGNLIQNVDAANITVPQANLPLRIDAFADAGSIGQTVSLSHVAVNGGSYDNVDITAAADYTGAVTQSVNFAGLGASNARGSSIDISANAKYGATALQTVDISGLTATDNGNGIFAVERAFSPSNQSPSVAAQYLTIDGAMIGGNAYSGVFALVDATGNAVARQDVNVSNATISTNNYGVSVLGSAAGGASSQQNVHFANDTVTDNTYIGIDINVNADGGFGAQYGTISHVDVSHNGRDGIRIAANAVTGGDAEQQLYMDHITADHEGREGVYISANAEGYSAGSYTNYPAHVQQDLYFVHSKASHNAHDGLRIYDLASNRAQIDQTVLVYGSHMDGNADYGLFARANAIGPATATYANGQKTGLNTNLYVEGSTADRNGLSGVYIYNLAIDASVVTEHLTVAGTDVSDNGTRNNGSTYNRYSGLVDFANATGYLSENVHYVTLAGSTFDGNSVDGADLIAAQSLGPGPFGVSIQIDTISDSDFSYNARAGAYFGMFARGNNGRAEVYAAVSGSNFSHNAGDGIAALAYAEGGSYVPGYSCFTVQGTTGYCAVVRESIGIEGSTVEDNGQSGIYMLSRADGYGAIYAKSGRALAPALYVGGSTIRGNAYAGISVYNFVDFGSYQQQIIAIDHTRITHNGTDGSYFNGPVSMLQGGISIVNEVKYGSFENNVLLVQGASISNNKGSGISDEGLTVRSEGLGQIVAVYDSKVDGNFGGGVEMLGFGFDVYGSVKQIFYSYDSHFDNNRAGTLTGPFKYGSGVTQVLLAEELGGSAYQYFGSVGSTFSNNHGAGAYSFILGGKLGYFTGNMTQVVKSTGDTFSNNGSFGLATSMDSKYANYNLNPNYQSVTIAGDTMDGNVKSGIENGIFSGGYSGVYETMRVADTSLDNNGVDGFYSDAYVNGGSFLRQNISFYSYHATASASGNGQDGIAFISNVQNSGMLGDNYVEGVTLSGNGLDGFYASGQTSGGGEFTSGEFNKYHVQDSTLNGNGDGVVLHSAGGGTNQNVYLTGNTIMGNTAFGVFAYAKTSSHQYVQVYTGGNTVSGSGAANYFFGTDGTATQTVN